MIPKDDGSDNFLPLQTFDDFQEWVFEIISLRMNVGKSRLIASFREPSFMILIFLWMELGMKIKNTQFEDISDVSAELGGSNHAKPTVLNEKLEKKIRSSSQSQR